MKLAGKTIWITGASSGIGLALTHQLVAENRLIISARSTSKLLELKKKYGSDKIFVLPFDLAEYHLATKWTEEAIAAFGKVDIVILNGGISQRSLIEDTQLEVYEKLIQIDYLAQVAIATAILPHFKSNKNGQYVVVSSLMGKFASPYRGGYAGAKHALHGFFEAMLLEQKKNGIAVTMICPGFVATEVSKNSLVADGSQLGTYDKANAEGLRPEIFAKKMIQAIAAKKYEVAIGGKEVMGYWIKRISNRFLLYIVSKSEVR